MKVPLLAGFSLLFCADGLRAELCLYEGRIDRVMVGSLTYNVLILIRYARSGWQEPILPASISACSTRAPDLDPTDELLEWQMSKVGKRCALTSIRMAGPTLQGSAIEIGRSFEPHRPRVWSPRVLEHLYAHEVFHRCVSLGRF